jgi:hypothetical protein
LDRISDSTLHTIEGAGASGVAYPPTIRSNYSVESGSNHCEDGYPRLIIGPRTMRRSTGRHPVAAFELLMDFSYSAHYSPGILDIN